MKLKKKKRAPGEGEAKVRREMMKPTDTLAALTPRGQGRRNRVETKERAAGKHNERRLE